jgi:hypothetical protein
MGLFNWIKFKRRDFRRDPRTQVRQDIKCSIQIINTEKIHEAWICDISKTGIGFLTRAPGYDIGETIVAHLMDGNLQIKSPPGRIVGQDIVYHGPLKDIEKSFFRFSIQFDSPLPESQLKLLQRP